MSRLKLHLDEVGRGRVRGWAVDLHKKDMRPVLDILLDGMFVGQALANRYRSDLKTNCIGDGFHGFEWRDPRLATPGVEQRIVVEWPRLGLIGRRSQFQGRASVRHFRSPIAYLTARFASLPNNEVYHNQTPAAPLPADSILMRLLEPAVQMGLGPCCGKVINAYQAYILHQFRRESDFDPGFTLNEYRRFLRWYIQHYGSVRANMRIPLSKQDIDFLHSALVGDPHRCEVMATFSEEFAARPNFEQADWVFYNLASLGIADCVDIVPNSERLALFVRQHPILAHIDIEKESNRDRVLRILKHLHPGKSAGSIASPRVESAFLSATSSKKVDLQIIGPFSKALGVGESCRRLTQALRLTNLSLRACDFGMDYPNDAISRLPFVLDNPGPARVNLIHLNLQEIPKLVAFWPDVFSGATNIAVPYLELSSPAPEQELGLKLVDRVFAATKHIQSVIGNRALVDVIGSAVELLPLPDRLAARRKALGGICGPDDLVVLVSGDALSGLYRKNLIGAIQAFKAAFPEEPNRRLVIKTHSTGRTDDAGQQRIWEGVREVAAQDPRIILIDRHLQTPEYRCLQAACDVYLSLHRAEGLGYHVLECMQLGIPCIVTNYSGTRDFSSCETAFPVSYDLVPVKSWQYPFTRGEQFWAEPRLHDAVMHLRMLAASPARGVEVGLQARQFVNDAYSLEAFSHRLANLLNPIVGAATAN